MNIAVYVPSIHRKRGSNFIVETFFPLFNQLRDHRFVIITDSNSDFKPSAGFEKIPIRSQPRNVILKRLWIERTLSLLLKKIKADVFISIDKFCSLNTAIPQYIIMPVPEQIKPAYARKARSLFVTSERRKKELLDKLDFGENKILVVYPSPDKKYSLLNDTEKESVKVRYSDAKEYFLYNSSFQNQEEFISLLKSFSHFKKRQQSNFKLLLPSNNDVSWQQLIRNYKYREDVVPISPYNAEERPAITAAAYALILSFNTDEDIASALNAMQAGVPVISTKDAAVNEIGRDAFLYSAGEIKDLGEKMMQLYRDELLRSQMIDKGKELVKNFTVEKSANRLWQSISEVLN